MRQRTPATDQPRRHTTGRSGQLAFGFRVRLPCSFFRGALESFDRRLHAHLSETDRKATEAERGWAKDVTAFWEAQGVFMTVLQRRANFCIASLKVCAVRMLLVRGHGSIAACTTRRLNPAHGV